MRLEVTYAGRWYFGLIFMLAGVCAISSNNVIYLIESILLSSLIVSVIAAYRSLVGISAELRKSPTIAGTPSRDQVRIYNRSRAIRYSVEIGEVQGRKFVPLAFAIQIPAQTTLTAAAQRVFEKRGRHHWDGIAVASSYPFGFIRIMRVLRYSGDRVIWPAKLSGGDSDGHDIGRQSPRAGTTVLEGEIRPMSPDDDWRSVVWTLSAKGGDPVVRARGAEQEDPAVILDLRGAPMDTELERRISVAASAFYSMVGGALGRESHSGNPPTLDSSRGGTLILVDEAGRRRIHGAVASLDQLGMFPGSDTGKKKAG